MAAHHPNSHQNLTDALTGEQSTSSESHSDSSDTSKGSPPSTPPSPEEDHEAQVRSVPVDNASYNASPNSSRRPRRHHQVASSYRLGAIDETSSVVSPDIPIRNPLRNFRSSHAAKLFGFKPPTLHSDGSAKPPNLYDGMVGPNGEKFSDLRENKRTSKPEKRQRNRRCWLLVGLAILLVVIGLAVGLGVGLTRKKSHSDNSGNTSPATNTSQGFPDGTWGITTYLTNVDTSCTPNEATWNCYPYQTYNQSVSGSLSTLDWAITTSNTNKSYLISSTNPAFSYPFANITLAPAWGSGADSSFAFTYNYRKTVVPSSPITSDGAAARCYYDNVLLSVRLYTERQKDAALTSAENANGGAGSTPDWPYALEYSEMVSEAPKCYRYVNGQDGDVINLNGTSAGGGCECAYQNYNV